MVWKLILVIAFLNEPGSLFCTLLKDFKQAKLFNTDYSIQHSFVHSLRLQSIAIYH